MEHGFIVLQKEIIFGVGQRAEIGIKGAME